MPAPVSSSASSLCCQLLLLALLLTLSPNTGAAGSDFTLPGLDGQSVRLANFRGQWVIVNFWASWCTPCLLEMPELESFYQAQRGRAVVVGVNSEALAPDEIRLFIEQLGVTFPIALSAGQRLPGFSLKGLPTTFLVSPTGAIVHTHLGAVNATLLAERLTKLERGDGRTGSRAAPVPP